MAEFDPDLIDDEDENPESQKSGPFKQLRDHAKTLERQLKQYDKELEELRQFKQERVEAERKASLQAAFKEVGLNEKQAELFLAARPDAEPTPEAVKAFAEEYGFVQSDGTESDRGFSPAAAGGSPGLKQRYTSEEWDELYKHNPNEAIRIANEGRVDFVTAL